MKDAISGRNSRCHFYSGCMFEYHRIKVVFLVVVGGRGVVVGCYWLIVCPVSKLGSTFALLMI